jgi:hypothetical protein
LTLAFDLGKTEGEVDMNPATEFELSCGKMRVLRRWQGEFEEEKTKRETSGAASFSGKTGTFCPQVGHIPFLCSLLTWNSHTMGCLKMETMDPVHRRSIEVKCLFKLNPYM